MQALLTHWSRGQYAAEHSSKSQQVWTRFGLIVASAVGIAAWFCSAAHAEVKKVAYPEVKVTIDKVYKPDARFDQMRAALAGAVKKKDVNALSKLIAPTFLWIIGGEPAEQMDLGRDAVQNFKVAFGFRASGEDVDGGVSDGPYWETLAYFVGDANYYAASDAGNLICGPLGAGAADEEAFEQARKKVEAGDDGAEWYFTLANTDVAKAPGDGGAPIAKIGTIALPLLSVFPTARRANPRRHQPTSRCCCRQAKVAGFLSPRSPRCLASISATPDAGWTMEDRIVQSTQSVTLRGFHLRQVCADQSKLPGRIPAAVFVDRCKAEKRRTQ